MNKFLLLIIIFLLLCYRIFYIENFSNNDLNYKNIFQTNIFDDKVIFLIANNPNITNETIDFLDNYDYDSKKTLVVRFRNDPNKLVKKICKDRTDMMIYRATLSYENNHNIIGFHGLTNNNKHIKYNVLTYTKKNISKKLCASKSFDLISNINNSNIKNKLKKLEYNKYIFFTEWFDNKEHTTGFSTLKNIIDNTNFKKLYLVGYTNLENNCDGKLVNTWHNVSKECIYFKNLDKKIKKKIQILK